VCAEFYFLCLDFQVFQYHLIKNMPFSLDCLCNNSGEMGFWGEFVSRSTIVFINLCV
jgi:hypothetical protein